MRETKGIKNSEKPRLMEELVLERKIQMRKAAVRIKSMILMKMMTEFTG